MRGNHMQRHHMQRHHMQRHRGSLEVLVEEGEIV